MAKTITDVSQQIIEHKNSQIQNVLRSIQRRGIVPLAAISKDCQVNFILGSSETQQNVCVNYLDLSKCTVDQCKHAIKVAVWEEYTGIFGISLERAWPFAVQQNPALVQEEITQRLCNNIVFVLAPPNKPCKQGRLAASPSIRVNKCYEFFKQKEEQLSTDGMSQQRGQCLDLDSSVAPEVTEIKTSHHFKDEEILAVLVPQHLVPLLPEEFATGFKDKIILVENTKTLKPIAKIPQSLTILHKETITPGTSFSVPDYEKVIYEKILPQHQQFSLHAVRLQTNFDFIPRYIANLSQNTALINASQAIVLTEYPDNSGWVLVHKSKVIDPEVSKKIKQTGASFSPHLDPSEIRDKILSAKGSFNMSRYYGISKAAQVGLCLVPGVTAIDIGYNMTMLSFPEAQRQLVGNLVELEKIGLEKLAQELVEATTTMQACFRMHKSKTAYSSAITAKVKVEKIEKELLAARHELELAKAKIFFP